MKKLVFLLVSFVALLSSCGSDSKKVNEIVMPLTVDYSKSIEQLIEEGNYDYAGDNITSNAFTKNEVTLSDTVITREAILLNFNHHMTSEDAVAQMRVRGLRPATAKELYALGIRYPRTQREIDIIALGSVTDSSDVPALWLRDVPSLAVLWSWDYGCSSSCWFLAFRD